jgi:hypothetical protein
VRDNTPSCPTLGSFDFETDLIAVDYQAPEPACLVVANRQEGVLIYGSEPVSAEPRWQVELKAALRTGTVWAGVNMPFDVEVARLWGDNELRALIRAALNEGRIVSLEIWDRCAQIEGRSRMKRPSMAGLCDAFGVPHADKADDSIRLTFGQYKGLPVWSLSPGHLEYLVGDGYSGVTLAERFWEKWPDLLPDSIRLTRRQVALQRRRNRGLRTDQTQVARLCEVATAELARLKEAAQTPMPLSEVWTVLVPKGGKSKAFELQLLEEPLPGEFIPAGLPEKKADDFRVVRANGKRNMKRLQAWVACAYQGNPPMTREPKRKPGWEPKDPNYEWRPSISTSKDCLMDSGDPYLESIADYGEWASVVNKDLGEDMLQQPTLHTRYWIASTTRTTSSSPNVQNFRRAAGIRECVIPRDGYCFVHADHTGAELCAAAQNAYTLLGRHDMLDKINAGEDLHTHVGADVAEMSYDELSALIKDGAAYERSTGPQGTRLTGAEYKEYVHGLCLAYGVDREDNLPSGASLFSPFKEFRQFGKIPNFGCLGGMTYAPTLAVYARRQGIRITVAQAERVLEAWRRGNPDGQALLDWVKRQPKSGYGFDIPIPGTGLIRRGAPFCAAANTLFQGYIAAVEGECMWAFEELAEDPEHVLSVCPGVNFIHDEHAFEVPIGLQSDAARAILEVMVNVPKELLPDVRMSSEITAMSVWSKNAKSIHNPSDAPRVVNAGKPDEYTLAPWELRIWTP